MQSAKAWKYRRGFAELQVAGHVGSMSQRFSEENELKLRAKRETIGRMVAEHHLSERRAWRLVGFSRNSYRNPPEPDQAMVELSCKIIGIALVRRRIRYLTVADDFSHESVESVLGYVISGQYVIRNLANRASALWVVRQQEAGQADEIHLLNTARIAIHI